MIAKLLLALIIGGAAGYFGYQQLNKPKFTEAEYKAIQQKAAGLEQQVKELSGQVTSVEQQFKGKTCFTGIEDPVYQQIRKDIVKDLTAMEVDAWQKELQQKRKNFLAEHEKYWRNGWVDEVSKRFDEKLVLKLKGTLRGEFKFDEAIVEEYSKFNFKLVIRGFNSNKKLNQFEYKSKDNAYTSSVEFQHALFGSDATLQEVSFVFDAPLKTDEAKYSHFAIRIPTDMKKKETRDGIIYGLDRDLFWGEVGSFSVRRI